MKISGLNPLARPFTFGDEFPLNNGGATFRASLDDLRDFMGVGTNIVTAATYPASDQSNPVYGKNGDLLLALDTNALYRKTAGVFPPVNQPTALLQGTRVNDGVIAPDTSWSSRKIAEYIRSAVAVVLDLAPNVPKRVPFFSKVLLESLRVSFGIDAFTVRLLLADATVISTSSGTGAATIGQISASINNLTAAQVLGGYNVEFTNTSAAALTAQVRTIPIQ